MDDGLSRVHYKTVRAEIEGRFFSDQEAAWLKEAIDVHTVIDPPTRVIAAKAWQDAEVE